MKHLRDVWRYQPERIAAVADGVLLIRTEFRTGPILSQWSQNRVVPKTTGSPWGKQQGAFERPLLDKLLAIWRDQRSSANKAGGTVLGRNIA